MNHVVRRSWPVGTRKRVKVINRVGDIPGGKEALVCLEEESGEAFVLIQGRSSVAIDTLGEIVFREGGPLGAFWEFESFESQEDV